MKKALIILICLMIAVSAFAQEQKKEEIILTTYYPAPHGDYVTLSTKTFQVNPLPDGPDGVAFTADDHDDNFIIDSSGNVGIGTIAPSVPLEVKGNIIAADPTADEHVVTKRYLAGMGSAGYDISKLNTYTSEVNTGDVTLVNISGKSGILLGGSIVGSFLSIANPEVTINIDGNDYTFSALLPETEGHEAVNDFHFLPLPGPIKFSTSLKISYTTELDDRHVSGIAHVIEN